MAALVATAGLGAAAFQIDAEVLTQVSTPATGLWIPAPVSGEIVHVDAASGSVTARVGVGEPGAEFVVAERDHGIIVVDRTEGQVALVDPALHEIIRSVRAVQATEANVDIGPEGVVMAADDRVALVDLAVTASTGVSVPPAARSAVADGAGARVENGTSVLAVPADGTTDEAVDASGLLVRMDDRVLVVGRDAIRTIDGAEVACVDDAVGNPTHVVGADRWVVAIVRDTVHLADVDDGDCREVVLPTDTGELGRPVVAGGRVYVPERRTGTVHIIEPNRGIFESHVALPPGDLRLRSRGELVVAYDAETPVAAFLGEAGVVRFVDTSIDERGIAAVLGDDGAAAVLGDDGGGEAVEGTGVDALRTDNDAPVIDATLLASIIENPENDDDALPDDELVANFGFSASTVAVGDAVRFVDSSTGRPDAWLWDFGDGTGAEGPQVEKAWDDPGTYPVTLRVSQGEESASITLAITVVPEASLLPPAADFVFSATVAEVGVPVAFEDRSDGEIERWRWDFGDGTFATDPDVTKAWDTPGRYEVQLTVANEQGSDSAVVFIDVIAGLEAPVAELTARETEVDLGAAVAFSGSSSGGPASFEWTFGDGGRSTGAEAVHVFLIEGTFTVTLTAANAAGTSTATVEIVVSAPTQPPVAAIGTLPPVIEVGDVVSLSSLSTNAPDEETWSFGDGETATGSRVDHTWTTPGSYILRLTATNSAGTDTVTTTVEVLAELPAPVAQVGDFDESPWVGDATVFLDASVDATSWLWDFGDGVTSTAPNPLHTFTTPGQKLVTLTVSNRNGTDSTSVVVEPRLRPTASFVVSSSAIRAGDSVTFTDQSVNAASWLWNFGDGTSSTAKNPVHSYTTTGSFGVSLTIKNATGDQDTFGPVVITVDPAAPRLSAILKVPVDTGNLTTSSTYSFAAVVAPTSGPIDLFEVDFGDGTPVVQAASGTFTHAFSASGSFDVTMRARGPLGDFSAPITRSFVVVDPAPPLVAIAASVPASAEIGTVTLTGETLGGSGPVATWRWRVRKGGEIWDYTGRVVDHLFTEAGNYTIRLTAESPVATVADAVVTQPITITVPPAPFIESLVANPSPATTGVQVTFTPVVTGSPATWEWDYEGGGTSYVAGTSIGQHIFNTAGPKLVYLRVTGPFGGQDVVSVPVTVNPRPAPTAPVAIPGGTVTTGTTVNLSSSDAGGLTGLTWNWEISNGVTTVAYADVGPSINHAFTAAGSWTVTVTAVDGLGISGSNLSFVTVTDPAPPLVAGFTWASTATPLQIQLTDTSTGPPIDSWSWNFGSAGAIGNTTAQNPLVTYPAPGTYSVTLTVTSGGDSSTTAPVTVTVP